MHQTSIEANIVLTVLVMVVLATAGMLMSRGSPIADKYGSVRIDPPADCPIRKLRMNHSSEFLVRSQDISEAWFIDVEHASGCHSRTEPQPKHEKWSIRRKRCIDDEDQDEEADENNRFNNNNNIHLMEDCVAQQRWRREYKECTPTSTDLESSLQSLRQPEMRNLPSTAMRFTTINIIIHHVING